MSTCGVGRRARGDLALAHGAAVHDEPGDRRLHVGDVDDVPVAADPAGVGQLAAALGVERGAVQDHLDGRARARGGHPDPVDDQPDDLRLGHQVGVAEERGAARGVEHGAVGGAVGVAVLVGGGVGLGPAALLGHERAEALLVDGEPGLGGHLERQVDREPVGVVQLERLVAGQLAGARLRGSRRPRSRRSSSRWTASGGRSPPRSARRWRCARSRRRAPGRTGPSRRARPPRTTAAPARARRAAGPSARSGAAGGGARSRGLRWTGSRRHR